MEIEQTKTTHDAMGAYLDDVTAAMHAVDPGLLTTALEWLEDAYKEGRGVYIAGNGGSAANASHLAEDLAKGALADDNAKRFRVLSLTDNTPFITAVANDIGYEEVFAFQLRQFAQPGDILIVISGSGNSPNIHRAAEWARSNGVKVLSFTGFDGGKLQQLSDLQLHVPINDMCKAEAVHAVLMHMIVDMLHDRFKRKT